ncbi:Predicted divalent heavy-metal cationstransporter [Synechocystis sp. PCC 6803]|nr:Predicted divalent heavy-metal cationstransporter [Synechocystis sp. PCC 6803] [Bacillus subtilis BEST7613]
MLNRLLEHYLVKGIFSNLKRNFLILPAFVLFNTPLALAIAVAVDIDSHWGNCRVWPPTPVFGCDAFSASL